MIDVIDLYGFKAPYRFGCAIAFMLAFLGLLFVGSFALYDFLRLYEPDLPTLTHFYFYLAGLYFLAALLAFKPKASFVLLAFAIIETSLSIGLIGYGMLRETLVADLRPEPMTEHHFVFHSLLQGIPKPLYHQETPFIKHDAEGRREVIDADEFQDESVPSVNVYGGSTTYDVKVVNGYTWVDHLQKDFGRKLRFYNYGVQGYSSVENFIQTAFYARHGKRFPVCGVYYVGWNDARNLHIPNLDPGYADFHLLGQSRNLSLHNRRPTLSPLLNMAITFVLGHYEVVRAPPSFYPDSEDTTGVDEHLEQIFTQNLEAIIALNESRGTKTFFIRQILNRFKLAQLPSRGVYGWMPKVRNKDVWTVQEHYNALMKAIAEKHHARYIDIPIDTFANSDFADEGHFSPAGSLKFSAYIAPALESCLK
jgi:hypothetical protein